MANTKTTIVRTKQVDDILRFLELTPAAASEILKASISFGTDEEPGQFHDLRRVREKMKALEAAGLVTVREYAVGGHKPRNFYQVSRTGHVFFHSKEPPYSYRRRFDDIAPTLREHTYDLSRLITHVVGSAHTFNITIPWARPENMYTIDALRFRTKPDFSAVFMQSGCAFNNFFECDRDTESIDSYAKSSIRNKILAYEAYYDLLVERWGSGSIPGKRPRLRAVFWTTTMTRAEHILAMAANLARNPKRLLVYAASMDSFLAEADALRQPVFLDHQGNWQALVNPCPSASLRRAPVRIAPSATDPHAAVTTAI